MALDYHQVLALCGGLVAVGVVVLVLLLLLRRYWPEVKTRMALSSCGGEQHSIGASVCSKDALIYGSVGTRPSVVSMDTPQSIESLMVRWFDWALMEWVKDSEFASMSNVGNIPTEQSVVEPIGRICRLLLPTCPCRTETSSSSGCCLNRGVYGAHAMGRKARRATVHGWLNRMAGSADRLLRRLEAIPEYARFVTAIASTAAPEQHPHQTRAVAVQPMPSAEINCSAARSPRRESQPPPPCRRPSQETVDSAALFLERRRSSEQTIGAIQPDLYRRRGSVVTQQSLKGLAIGRVQLKLDYEFAKSDFIVSVLDAKDISSKIDEFYLKVFLGPEDDGKRRESVKRKKSQKNREGQFERQDFKFPVTYDELLDKRLLVQLFDCGRIGRMQTMAGEVSIDLSSLDPSADLVVWADVESKSGSDNYGDILVALTYLPSVERLTVTLHQARDLRKMDITGGADPYVKVALVQDGKVTKKRKTSVRKNSLTPVWNEALNFSLNEKALKKTQIELQIMDHDLIGNDEIMGLVTIGTESSDSKAQFMWEDFANGKSSAPTWLKLVPCPAHKRRLSS